MGRLHIRAGGIAFLFFLGAFGLRSAFAYEAMEVKEGGKIAGRVKVAGKIGERGTLKVFKYTPKEKR